MFQLHYSASIICSRKDTQVSDPKSADNILKAISVFKSYTSKIQEISSNVN